MKRLAVEAMPDVAFPRWFKCPACRLVVPELRWSDQEARRYLLTGRDSVCDACRFEPPPDSACACDGQ